MNRIIVIAIGCLSLPALCLAARPDAGTNNPFEIGTGSRSQALGGAYVAVADDTSAMFWNPAGLAQLDQAEFSAMHVNLFFDTPYDFIGLAYPLLNWGTFSVGAVRIATGGIILRDEQSQLSDSGQGSTDLREFLFAFSREIIQDANVGATLKIDQQRLLGNFATGVGLDLGFHYRFSILDKGGGLSGIHWERLTWGLVLQNLVGSRLRLDEMTDALPLNVQTGLAYDYPTQDSLQQHILVSTSWTKSTWRASQIAIGLEYGLLDLLAVRGGWNTDNWSVGGGVHYIGISLDYALTNEELGLTHRFTLAYRFGPSLSEQRQEQERRYQAELDKEAEARARLRVEETKRSLEEEAKQAEIRYQAEKRQLLAKNARLQAEQNLQREDTIKAVAGEYFKASHYFQGIKAYLVKNYKEALLELETVAKYDPNYMELQLYINRAQQNLTNGGTKLLSPENLEYYYKGVDLYVENQFAAAIEVWRKILVTDKSNILVLRNIEEAENRLAKLSTMGKTGEGEAATPVNPLPTKEPLPQKTIAQPTP